jgi:enoyl-CoA hydratase
MTDSVLVSLEGAVGRITLNAPDRLNALDVPMLTALEAAVRTLDADAGVRVIALAGTGRGFCSGADIGTGALADAGLDGTLHALGGLVRVMADCATPLVALVHGVAAGAGLSLALACDYVLAGSRASFVLAFARIGLMPDGGATALVAASVGRARAMRMALTGEKVDASTAADWGLVSELVEAEAFDARAAEVLAELAGRAPLAVAATRRAINAAALDLDAAIAREELGQTDLLATADFVEGVMAFREKRAARFDGH